MNTPVVSIDIHTDDKVDRAEDAFWITSFAEDAFHQAPKKEL